jgi:excisionase family DNA binding protein
MIDVNERKTAAMAIVAAGLDRVDEVARFLGLSRSYIYELMERGELVYVKVGRSRRIPHHAVLQLAARHLVERAPTT